MSNIIRSNSISSLSYLIFYLLHFSSIAGGPNHTASFEAVVCRDEPSVGGSGAPIVGWLVR